MQNTALAGLSILIVEDDVLLRRQLTASIERMGADVTSVDSIARARMVVGDLGFDFALLDVNLPDGRSIDLLKERVFSANTGIIIMTAEGNVLGAVEAMKLGALDYLVKPFDPAELPLVIARARRAKQSERIDEHKRSADDSDGFFFGASLAPMHAQLEKILAADKRLETQLPPVLIEGETGTGKTTIARWIHNNGPRSSQPLVEVNCSALPESLAESELFGHERGAFTDARTARMGLFEAANGGTLFLDELPSLSQGLQAKVLTALEDHKIRRVGGSREIPVDVRIIAATNRDLRKLVVEGSFREDLFHRLDLFRIAIPPLRDRGDDILKLTDRLLDQLCRRHRLPRKRLHPEGRKNILAFRWPGNVRELAHELERAIVFDEAEELKFEQLAGGAAAGAAAVNAGMQTGAGMLPEEWFNDSFRFPPQGFSLDEAINRMIQHALKQTGGNVSGAARLLGVTRDYVRYRLAGQRTAGSESPVSSNASEQE